MRIFERDQNNIKFQATPGPILEDGIEIQVRHSASGKTWILQVDSVPSFSGAYYEFDVIAITGTGESSLIAPALNTVLALNINAVFRGSLGATGATGACFIAGTEIETVSGIKKIEDIVDGDKVVCAQWDATTKEISYTEEEVYSKIAHSERYHLLKTTLEDNTSFVSTFDHFIFSPDGSYKQACDFRVGDNLISYKDKKLVKIIGQDLIKPLPTYNFEVKTHHNYIANGIVVHNGGLTKLEYNSKTVNNNFQDNIVMYNSTNTEWQNVTYKAPFTIQAGLTASKNTDQIYKFGSYGYSSVDWDDTPDSAMELNSILQVPFNTTIMGYYIHYTDTVDARTGIWDVKPHKITGLDQGLNFSGAAHAPSTTAVFSFETTNLSNGKYGTMGNYLWVPVANYADYRPFGSTYGWHFEAGDRVLFQCNRHIGDIPMHNITLVGVCDLFGGPDTLSTDGTWGWNGGGYDQ